MWTGYGTPHKSLRCRYSTDYIISSKGLRAIQLSLLGLESIFSLKHLLLQSTNLHSSLLVIILIRIEQFLKLLVQPIPLRSKRNGNLSLSCDDRRALLSDRFRSSRTPANCAAILLISDLRGDVSFSAVWQSKACLKCPGSLVPPV